MTLIDIIYYPRSAKKCQKNFKKCPKILHFLAESRVKNTAPLSLTEFCMAMNWSKTEKDWNPLVKLGHPYPYQWATA